MSGREAPKAAEPVAVAALSEGETVLDLGSGTGKICFIASQVVGPEGRVIGVATLTPGGGLGICLGTRELLEFLPTAAEWIERAERNLAAGRLDAVRQLMDLAMRRRPTTPELAQIENLRLRLALK